MPREGMTAGGFSQKARYPLSKDVRSRITTIHDMKRQQGVKYTIRTNLKNAKDL
jgi:hypothetical protein